MTSMRLCGVTDVDQLGPALLNTKAVDQYVLESEEHPYIQWRPKAQL
jgi:L-lactate dehydrogenase (cytochrome)